MVRITHHPTPTRLKPYIERVAVIDFTAACGKRWQVMPTGHFGLGVNLGTPGVDFDVPRCGHDITFTGVLPHALSTWCDRPVLVLGVTLTALAVAHLPARPHNFADLAYLSGDQFLSRTAVDKLCAALAAQAAVGGKVAAMLGWIESMVFDHRPAYGRELTIAETASQMHRLDGPDLAGAALRTGLSRRQLEREFRHRLGTSPKHYDTVAKVQKFARMAWHGETLAAISAALNFADQAHMTNVVRDMTGMTPALLLRRAAGSDFARAMRPFWGGRITHV
jgi:AraC-like DNA-binding protein